MFTYMNEFIDIKCCSTSKTTTTTIIVEKKKMKTYEELQQQLSKIDDEIDDGNMLVIKRVSL